jgi:hypothetical protein
MRAPLIVNPPNDPAVFWLDALVACLFPLLAVGAFSAGLGVNLDGGVNVPGSAVILLPTVFCFFATLLRWSHGLWFGWLFAALGVMLGLLMLGGLAWTSPSESAKPDFLTGLARIFGFFLLMFAGGAYMGLRPLLRFGPKCR